MATPDREPCTCDWLQRAADDPKCPIEFDAKTNEYHLILSEPDCYFVLYHCPWCGGKAPQSKRSLLFHTLDDAERKRLVKLTRDLRTVRDVVIALGEPDKRFADGFTTVCPEREGNPELTEPLPMIVYEHLSKVADVQFTIYPNDGVAVSFRTKSLQESSSS